MPLAQHSRHIEKGLRGEPASHMHGVRVNLQASGLTLQESQALAAALGTDQVAFTMTSGPPFADIKRSFTSLSHAARESVDSRVYAGIHFRSACEDGLALGQKIGLRAARSYLQPLGK